AGLGEAAGGGAGAGDVADQGAVVGEDLDLVAEAVGDVDVAVVGAAGAVDGDLDRGGPRVEVEAGQGIARAAAAGEVLRGPGRVEAADRVVAGDGDVDVAVRLIDRDRLGVGAAEAAEGRLVGATRARRQGAGREDESNQDQSQGGDEGLRRDCARGYHSLGRA